MAASVFAVSNHMKFTYTIDNTGVQAGPSPPLLNFFHDIDY